MELVINIPEALYDRVKNMDYEQSNEEIVERAYRADIANLFSAVANGTPLPKGHGRLIDISEYEDNYFNTAIKYDDGDQTHEKYTFALPTIIEAEKGEEK